MEKFKKRLDRICVIIFCIAIILPLIFVNKQVGRIAEGENRYLASFPQIKNEEGNINKNFSKQFEEWINDNIGFRELFVKANQKIKYGIFNLLPEENSYLGKDNWIYLADEWGILEYQHLNLPTEDELKYYSSKHQDLNNYLDNRGIEYISMLWPAKQTVYPENFPDTILKVGDVSRLEIIQEYMKKNDMIDFSVPMDALMKEKENRIIYSPIHDRSHWNNYGAFIGYTELMKKVKTYFPDIKILEEKDFEITPYSLYTDMYGVETFEETEYEFKLKKERSAYSDKAIFDREDFISKDPWKSYNRYINEDSNLPKALIIGDSYIWMFMLPNLAESFSEIIFLHHLDGEYVGYFIDEINPDIVINATLEHAFSSIESVNVENNIGNRLPEEIEGLVEKENFLELYYGMQLDYSNGKLIQNQGVLEIDFNNENLTLNGIAIDFLAEKPASDVFVQVGNKFYKVDYGQKREDVSEFLGSKNYKNTGFTVTLNTKEMLEQDLEFINFIIVSNDRTYRYAPIKYQIKAIN